MKKLSVILSIMAVTLAAIGTYADNKESAFVDGYEFIGTGIPCNTVSDRCTTTDTPLCTASGSGTALRDNPNATNCGAQLHMP
jgi:hypothetical protein